MAVPSTGFPELIGPMDNAESGASMVDWEGLSRRERDLSQSAGRPTSQGRAPLDELRSSPPTVETAPSVLPDWHHRRIRYHDKPVGVRWVRLIDALTVPVDFILHIVCFPYHWYRRRRGKRKSGPE